MPNGSSSYTINEVFYSLQGEGLRVGTPNVFVRFTGCNMQCAIEPGPKSPGGFDCDTEFASGRQIDQSELLDWIRTMYEAETNTNELPDGLWLVLTGGEPALQVDREFCDWAHHLGFRLAIETNGSIALPTQGRVAADAPFAERLADSCLDWICVSPKVAEHAIRQRLAHEVKYVRGYGQAIPKTVVEAEHKLISPAFDGSHLDPKTFDWCKRLVKQHPTWRLSVQQHKGWNER